MTRSAPMITLLVAAFTIAVWQATEVVERIQQLLWFQEKFSGYANEIRSITAGTFATGLFIVGSSIGVAICLIGIRRASRLKSKCWKPVFFLALCSIIIFGVSWVALIMSPYVVLHTR